MAPAPSLSPATISLSAIAKTIISLIHSDPASPELLFYLNARDQPGLQQVAQTVLPFLKGRSDALSRYLAENESNPVRVSEKTKTFWLEKKQATDDLLGAVQYADKSDAELDAAAKTKRVEYFENTKVAWEVGLALVLEKLSKEIVGPFVLGNYPKSIKP